MKLKNNPFWKKTHFIQKILLTKNLFEKTNIGKNLRKNVKNDEKKNNALKKKNPCKKKIGEKTL